MQWFGRRTKKETEVKSNFLELILGRRRKMSQCLLKMKKMMEYKKE